MKIWVLHYKAMNCVNKHKNSDYAAVCGLQSYTKKNMYIYCLKTKKDSNFQAEQNAEQENGNNQSVTGSHHHVRLDAITTAVPYYVLLEYTEPFYSAVLVKPIGYRLGVRAKKLELS